MIIGNGLIATTINNSFLDHTNLCIFAAGVSNSSETNESEFQREFDLLKNTLADNTKKKFIYFSTVSIDVKKNSPTPYTTHKLNMEKYIEDNTTNYLILRLPNVVGNSTNPNQLVNYFYNSLINDTPVAINKNYIRHLLDVEDIPMIIKFLLIKHSDVNNVVVAFPNGIIIDNLLSLLEKINGNKFNNTVEIENPDIELRLNTIVFNSYLGIMPYKEVFNTVPLNILKKYYK
jgi:nucleoside-diphosphate-sugar epimerase